VSILKLQGNESGTGIVTIGAPNTNTDQTINIPDGAGSFVTADSSGNVGIGTSSPSSALDVDVSQDAETNIELTNTNTGSAAQVRTKYTTDGGLFTVGKVSDAHVYGGDAYLWNVDNTGIRFATSDTQCMVIDNSGNVGIGTDSPNVRLDSSINDSTEWNTAYNLSNSNNLPIYALKLENTDTSITNTEVNLLFSAGGSGSGLHSIGVKRTGTNTGDMIFRRRNNSTSLESMRITSSGNVGIGTDSPDSTLHVGGNGTYNYIHVEGGNANLGASIRLTHTGGGSRTGYESVWTIARGSNETDFGAGVTASNAVGGLVFWNQASGGSVVDAFRLKDNGDALFGGKSIVVNPTTGDGDDSAINVAQNDYTCWDTIFRESWIGNSAGWGTFWAGSSGALYRRVSGDTNPNEYVMVGSGNKRFTFDLDTGGHAYFDGTLTQNSYDYAEYFEWEDGNPNNEDRRGYSVVLTDSGKIEKATSESNSEDIFGVISGTAAIIGDAAMYDWNEKYLVDEWGTLSHEIVDQISWTDQDGNHHSYDSDQIPEGLTVPDDAGRKTHKRALLNPNYNSDQEYIPRDKRQEWDPVGMLGKVRIRDESPKNPRWRYIKTIADKELWLIR